MNTFRTLLILFCLIIVSCKHHYDPKKDFDLGTFQPIPNHEREYLIDKIKPSDNYSYWQWMFRDVNPFDSLQHDQRIIYHGDSLRFSKIADKVTCDFGFFVECEPGICFSYIVGISDNDKIKLIDTEEKLRSFIGEIDNIEEAILTIKTHDYWYDSDTLIAGAYKKVNSDYLLYLLDYSSTPVTYKSVKAVLTKRGVFKVLDKKIYKQTNEFIMS